MSALLVVYEDSFVDGSIEESENLLSLDDCDLDADENEDFVHGFRDSIPTRERV